MSSTKPRFQASILVVLIGIALVAADRADGPAADYLRGVANLEGRFAHCSGEAVESEFGHNKEGKPMLTRKTRYEFAFSGGQGKLITAYIANAAKIDAPKAASGKQLPKVVSGIGFNEKQSFTVSKSSMNSDYVIVSLEVGPETARKQIAGGMRNPLSCLTKASAMSLPSLIRSPKCHVERLGEVSSPDGVRRIRFNYKMDPVPITAKRSWWLTSGWFVTSPEEGWAISEFGVVRAENVEKPEPSTWVGRVEYSREADGEIRPIKAVSTLYRGALDVDPAISELNLEKVNTQELQFTKFRFGLIPSREFTLAAFGLPEFGEPAARRLNRPFPWWIVGASLGFGGLAWILRRVGKRPRKPVGSVA